MKEEYKIIKLNEKEFKNLKLIVAKEYFNLKVNFDEEIDEVKLKERENKIKDCNTLFTILSYVER